MTPWILLRGLSREHRHWGDFPDQLGQALPDASIHCLDTAGSGIRYREQSPLTIASMVEDCRLQRDRSGAKGPVTLLAMSLGAMIAIDWAARYPDEIERCVLINTSLRSQSRFHWRLRPGNYPRLLRMALPCSDQVWESAVLAMTSRHAPAGTLKTWLALRAECPVSSLNVLRQLLAAARYQGPIHRPSVPILLLGSTADRLVDIRCSRAIARRWGVPLVEHPTAGHDLPLDDPKWVVNRISDWLNQAATLRDFGLSARFPEPDRAV